MSDHEVPLSCNARVHHIDLHAFQFSISKSGSNKAHQISIFGFQCVAQIIK
jgi:hypothetical protein